jgi:hypothetical protein
MGEVLFVVVYREREGLRQVVANTLNLSRNRARLLVKAFGVGFID